jgi:hypothetical protein
MWKFVNIKNYKFNIDSNCILVNRNEIMIFGGYNNAEEGVKDCYSILFKAGINNL